jgi:general secretion pathway protein N
VADHLRPLTLLLGAACLWALSVLVLALAGLGGGVAPAAGGAVAPAIPKVSLTPSQSRLGPAANYAEVGQRPLLNQDRRPGLAPVEGGGSGELDVVLSSVLITPRLQMAVFTDNKDASSRRVRLGEVVPGSNWRLAVLEPRRAVLEGPSGQRELGLRVFDGKGGQAPTPAAEGSRPQAADAGDGSDAVREANMPPPPVATPAPSAPVAAQSGNDTKPDASATAPLTQEQQVEAIRRRIEARRAQMRAEAAAAAREK